MNTSLRDEFVTECIVDVDNSFEFILHCIHQMEAEMIWWQPNDTSLSAGYLVTHVIESTGRGHINIQQTVNSAPQKIIIPVTEKELPKNELISGLIKTKNEIIASLKLLTEIDLMKIYEVNSRPVVLLGVVFRSLSHISYHAGQIAYVAKLQLKENYRPFWITDNKNEESSDNSQV